MYISTRGNYNEITASQAIKLGMVPTGGLFVPENIPEFSFSRLQGFIGASYQELAEAILQLYLDDYAVEEIRDIISKAYNESSFAGGAVAPIKELTAGLQILELWHGPTAAFKDVALQIMPHLLAQAVQKIGTVGETVILVATSGDTGKAALEGFKDIPGIRIIVFYPYQGVSPVQELQMTTTTGENTHVIAVEGNFDDCQAAVKAIFADQGFSQQLAEKGYEFSSANSINWGRLLPQLVYYFSAYVQMVEQEKLVFGEKLNFVVPTGNFGNILAGWYAGKMGLPIGRLICASNDNKVLTDFFSTGIYDRQRAFYPTITPSMDILISSNLERFLFEMNGRDAGRIKEWMNQLQEQGNFQVDATTKKAMDEIIWAGFATEEETIETIGNIFKDKSYALDPHTAVGMKVYADYQQATADSTATVLISTASPFKFSDSVLKAIVGEKAITDKDEFSILAELTKVTGLSIHPGLEGLEGKPILHHQVVAKEEVQSQIKDILGIE